LEESIGQGGVMSIAMGHAIVGQQIVVELHAVVVEVFEGGFGPRSGIVVRTSSASRDAGDAHPFEPLPELVFRVQVQTAKRVQRVLQLCLSANRPDII
jgi:hypothetical protein